MMAQLDEIKKILRSLLVSAPVKVTVSSLNRDYKSLEGRPIPFKELGFNSLLHLLHSIPDVLRVNGLSFESEVALIITDKVAHVSDMVMKQKKPTKGRNACKGRKSVIQQLQMNTTMSEISNSNSKSDINNKKYVDSEYEPRPPLLSYSSFHTVKESSPFPRPLLPKERNLPSFTTHKTHDIQTTKSNFHNNNIEEKSCQAHMNDLNTLPKTSSTNCDRVPSLSKHMPHNIVKHSSLEEQHLEPKSKLGRLRLSRLSNKHEENNCVIASNNATVTEENDIEKIITFENEDDKIPIGLQNELKRLIKSNSSGIRCTDLPFLYKKMFHKNLDYQRYGFDRLISLCMNLDRIFHCEEESDWDFKLYDKDNPPLLEKRINEEKSNGINITNIISKNIDISQIKAVKSKDWDIYTNLIPEDSLKLGEDIESNSLNEYNIGETFQVVISEIYNPSKFWIYRNDGNLNEMMNLMQTFYSENKTKYLIPEFLIDVGLYCVVHTLKEFQRALIIDLLQDLGGYVKVFLIDYGTLTNLSRDKIWFLSKQFCILPAQAVETTLAGIAPKEGVWTNQSILRFKDMIVSKYIFARILEKQGQTLSVNITVMNKPLETLNDLLVQEGYAEYIADCKLQDDATNDFKNPSPDTNPRKRLIERLRLKNRMKNN